MSLQKLQAALKKLSLKEEDMINEKVFQTLQPTKTIILNLYNTASLLDSIYKDSSNPRSLEAIYALLTVYDMADKVKGLRTNSKQDYKGAALSLIHSILLDRIWVTDVKLNVFARVVEMYQHASKQGTQHEKIAAMLQCADICELRFTLHPTNAQFKQEMLNVVFNAVTAFPLSQTQEELNRMACLAILYMEHSEQSEQYDIIRDVFKVIIDDVDNSQIATKLQEKFDMISTQCLKDPTPQDLEDSSEQEATKHSDDPAFKSFRLFSEIQSLPPKKRYAPMVYEATKKQPEDQLPLKKRLNGFLCSESKRQKTEEPRFENEAVSDVAQFRK